MQVKTQILKSGEPPLVMETRNEVCDNSGSVMASGYSTLRSICSRKHYCCWKQVSTEVSNELLFNGIINHLNITTVFRLFSVLGNTLLGCASTKPALLSRTAKLPLLYIDYKEKVLRLSSTYLDKHLNRLPFCQLVRVRGTEWMLSHGNFLCSLCGFSGSSCS